MRVVSLAVLGLLVLDSAAHGMASEQVGPDKDHPTVAQPEWPKGIESLPRHPSRVYSLWVNGNESFHFKAGPAQVKELLALLSSTRMRDHEVWIKRGKPQVQSFNKTTIEYNVSLRILSGLALAHERSQSGVASEPQLTVYLDDAAAVEPFTLPDNVILHVDAPGVPLKGKAVKPQRRQWYGRIQFAGDGAGGGALPGIRTHISLWEAGAKDEIKLTSVDRDGLFAVAFSEQELAALKRGTSRLAITVGNWLTEAKKDDPAFPVERLGDRNTVEAVKIPAPKFYYGRLLFEDGTPARLKPDPWPGARIMIDFSYAGSVEPDDEGYFKVFFTEEQYAKVKADKPRKNIYIPSSTETGQSTAKFAFPAALLSHDKAQAGTVRLPRE